MNWFFAIDLDRVLTDQSTPRPWELAGITMTEYGRLTARDRHDLLKKYKPDWVVTGFRALAQNIKHKFLIWKRRPKHGYLLQTWFKHNAETSEFKGPPDWWYNPPEWKMPKAKRGNHEN